MRAILEGFSGQPEIPEATAAQLETACDLHSIGCRPWVLLECRRYRIKSWRIVQRQNRQKLCNSCVDCNRCSFDTASSFIEDTSTAFLGPNHQ